MGDDCQRQSYAHVLIVPAVFARWALVAGLVALGGAAPTVSAAAGPIVLTAGFGQGARLGSSTEMHAALKIDTRRLPSPVTAVRVLYPKGLGIVTSGLGLASCVRAQSEFEQVLLSGPGPAPQHSLAGCPPNAVLGYGTARAEVRLGDGQVIPESATVTVFAGPLRNGTLGLVAIVDGQHPFGARLVYGGELASARGAFGGALEVRTPAIPSIADLATVAMTGMRLSIGSRRITYYRNSARRTGAYHPDGIVLPDRCPTRGLRFRVRLTFQNGTRAVASTTVGCGQLLPAEPH